MRLQKIIITILLLAMTSVGMFAQQTTIFTEPHEQYKKALDFFEVQNYSLSQELLDDFVKNLKNNHGEKWELLKENAQYQAAICAHKLEQPGSIMRFKQIIIDYPGNRQLASKCNFQIARGYYEKKKYKEAISYFEEVDPYYLPQESINDYYFQKAYSYFIFKKFDEAQQLFTELTRVKNRYQDAANYYIGFIDFQEEKYDQALSSFKRVENDELYSKTVPYLVAQIYYKQKRFDELISYTVPKLEMRGLKFRKELNHLLGQTYYNSKKFKEALPYLKYYVDKSSKVRKEDLYQLAYTQYQFGQYDEAIKNFTDLNTLEDELGQNAQYHLAACHLKKGEKDKARFAFASASKLDFDAGIKETAAFNYAKLSAETGYEKEAIQALIAFINDYPSSSYSNESKNLLADLLENASDYKEALSIIESIPNRPPRLNESYQKMATYRGVELHKAKKYEEAMELFQMSHKYKIRPELTQLAQYWMSDIHYQNGDLQQARQGMQSYLSASGGRAASPNASPATANYTIAYTYLKAKDYKMAAQSFNQAADGLSRSSNQTQRTTLYADALLRGGDSYFMSKDYNRAKRAYQGVIDANLDGADYAYYQNGMILGLEGNTNEKIRLMESLYQKYPKSNYQDDAKYQVANTYFNKLQYQKSINKFQELINNNPDSELVPKSLVSIGLIHYNQSNNSEALSSYERVIKKYPKTPEAQDAIVGMKDIYIGNGDAEGFRKKMRQLGIDVSAADSDEISYQAAEAFYDNGDCQNAINAFSTYLAEFSKGAYSTYAHFYRGDCLYGQKNYLQAIKDFDFVIEQPNNIFKERALDKAARIAYYKEKNYEKAFRYYRELEQVALKRTYSLEAVRGLMRTAFKLNKRQEVEIFVSALLDRDDVTEDDIIEGNFYAGVMAYDNGQLNKALSHLDKVIKLTTNDMGAEARYKMAEIYMRQGQLEQAKTMSYRVINEAPSSEIWYLKSYIILADYYTKKNELFQAKQTLISIRDGYKGDNMEIRREVEQRLNEIMAKERANSKLQDDKPTDNQYLETQEEDQ